MEHVNTGKTLGGICEVKTGNYDHEKLFRREYVRYSAKQLGMTNREEDIARIVDGGTAEDVGDTYRIIKLFVSNRKTKVNFKNCKLEEVIQFF